MSLDKQELDRYLSQSDEEAHPEWFEDEPVGLTVGALIRLKPHESVRRGDVGSFHLIDAISGATVALAPDPLIPRIVPLVVDIDAVEPEPSSVPLVVHVLLDDYDYYIGRAMPDHGLAKSVFANPYAISTEEDRPRVIRAFGRYLSQSEEMLSILPLLRGTRIACWCKKQRRPSTPCHGDVVVAILRAADDEQIRDASKQMTRREIVRWEVAVECADRVAERIDEQ